ncbi:undecaprenyl-phosphate alpha-N-acetylglucosaminyl 1-phosphate transferase [Cnuibacter physcomitrellae]|uniref:Undecaprenyl-phosphate alpha-N-acetylglucosaminyl 1-phosphate transferase n=1 Tax=Cnuibacter physcomitrellae TaxID=1619308 RepID=A0A1X9LR24_9MICO|nr:MraY family glycosyltransferase [Cnuibacter physcomitrellae]ARJ05589.1 undecaprenyl-phosphate alpha-N-acetylglucosaminyl 1-phosphate transferase [Cnuibacter physcomitrellae]GGI36026.1 undecaprenyl-phosphate alpha-N-acetylglucosaminyl 1-phosphate transferase [Cnuibacter physcomitrellae]
MRFYLLVALVSAIVTFGLAWLIYKLSIRYRLYPKIRERDVHTRPTPRLGGIAMFLGLLGGIAVASQISWFRLVFAEPGQLYAILGSALIIVVIGVADDIYDLSWFTKLAGQILAAGLLAWQGVQIVSLPIGGITVGSSTMSLFITIVAVVLVMNAVNFIDGLDGLVAGVALIANGVFFLYSYLLAQETSPTDYFNLASMVTAVLIGACAGFLPLNFRPAKLFMGDSGAMLVGLLMATSAISVTGQIDPATIGRSQLLPAFLPILLPFAILVIPLLDFTLAVARRLRAGKSPFAADRKHLHHRLLDMGHSHLRAVLIFYSWTAVISFGCLLLFVVQPYWVAFIFLGLGLVVCAVVTLLPLSSRYRRRVAVSHAGQSGAVSLPEPPLAANPDPEESPS